MIKLKLLWFRVLDIIAPAEARLYAFLLPRSWASVQAQDILDKSRRRQHGWIRAYLDQFIVRIMQPEEWPLTLLLALFIIFVPQLLLYVGPHRFLDGVLNPFRQTANSNFNIDAVLTSAWQVLAAVIGLTFVIVVFLTQFVHERAYERHAFPLFAARTWMVFNVIFGLLTLVSLGLNALMLNNPTIPQESLPSLTGFNLLLFLLNISLTIRLYIVTYRLIDPRFFRRIFLEYNREQVARSVEAELQRRITLQLVSQHCSKYGIKFSLSKLASHSNAIGIRLQPATSDILQVTDINLRLLRLASERAQALTTGEDSGIVFTGYLESRISSEKPEVAYVPVAANRPQVTALLLRSVRLTPLGAVVGAQEDENLRLNRDLISDAIHAGRAEVVEELLDQYLEALRAFLTALEEHGLRYTAETAREEDGFFQDWSVVRKIQKHYFDLAEQALRISDREIVHHFVAFPLHVMFLAYRYQDQLIFRRFARCFDDLYKTAQRVMTDIDQRNYVFKESWLLLVEFYGNAIRPKLEASGITEAQAKVLGDYTEFLIIVLNRLLKSALDFRDLEQFRHFASAAEQIPAWVGRSPIDEVEDLQAQLEFVHDEERQRQLEEEIAKTEVVAKQLRRGKEARQISFMGLGGWLVHLLETNQIVPKVFQDYTGTLAAQFMDTRKFYVLYSSIVSLSRTGDPFGWDWWELEERPESYGQPTLSAMQYSDWIGRYYLYRAIELSPLALDAIPDLQPTSVSKQVAESVNKDLDVMNSSAIWRSVLVDRNPGDFQRRAVALREMHLRAAKRQESIEEDELVRQPLDDELVQAFISQVQKYWSELATIRSLFKYFGRYVERPDATVPDGLTASGIKQLEPKGAFVKQNRIIYALWGEGYGGAIARGEDARLCASFSTLPTVEAAVSDFDSILQRYLHEFRDAGGKPVILYGGRQLHRLFFDSTNYEPRWRTRTSIPDIAGVEGLFDGVLVANLPEIQEDVVLAIDFANFGFLVQYAPDHRGQFPLSISVREITPQVAAELLERQPELGRNPDTSEPLERESALTTTPTAGIGRHLAKISTGGNAVGGSASHPFYSITDARIA